MAKISFKGLAEYERQLEALGDSAGEATKKAVYSGAGVVADAIRANIQQLPTSTPFKWGTERAPTWTVSPEQKQGLLDGLGVSQIVDDDGFINAKVGFAGYNAVKSKKYPKGQPNVLIARSVESGTSIRKKTPFVRPALKQVRQQAQEAMAAAFDEATKDVIK